MRVAEVIGTVTLCRRHPNFEGLTFKVALPLTYENLTQDTRPTSENVVLIDQLGCGVGDRIALCEGPEATQPFRPKLVAVDAYNAAILDAIRVRPLPAE